MDFASGSAYGHQGLAQMRPVIVRQSGLTLFADIECIGCQGAFLEVGGAPADYSVDNHSRRLMESAP